MQDLHIAASPEYLQGISDERQRIIDELNAYIDGLHQPSYSINLTTLNRIIVGGTK